MQITSKEFLSLLYEMTSGRASDTERDFSHLFSAQNADRYSQGFTEHARSATTKGYIFTARNCSC